MSTSNECGAKQCELKDKELLDKEIANLAIDKRKNKDLNTLKDLGGPFTSTKELDLYLQSELTEENKVSRLYLEIRYARDTSLSIPKASDIFRLMKDHKKLSLEAYSTNLKIYLNKTVANSDVTLVDLNRAIDAMH